MENEVGSIRIIIEFADGVNREILINGEKGSLSYIIHPEASPVTHISIYAPSAEIDFSQEEL